MTGPALKRKALGLARRPYDVDLFADRANDGSFVYVARVQELPGCLAQGDTRHEALIELDSVLVECIESILEDGLDVPAPRILSEPAVQRAHGSATVNVTSAGRAKRPGRKVASAVSATAPR